MRILVCVLALGLGAASLWSQVRTTDANPPSTRPVTEPAATRPLSPEFLRAREEQRKNWLAGQAGIKRIDGTHRLADILRVEFRNNDIKAYSNFLPEQAGRRNELTVRINLEGLGEANLQMAGPRDGKRPLQYATVSAMLFDDPDIVAIHLNLHVADGSFGISSGGQRLRGAWTGTSLGIQGGAQIEAGMPRVQISYSDGNRHANAAAQSLHELLATQRPLIEQRIRPLLRRFEFEQILAADPETAWQVFLDAWPSDAKVAQEVARLLPRLDDNRFEVREDALAELEKLGKPGALAARRLDRAGLSEQQNSMLDRLLTPYLPVPLEDARKLEKDINFLVDCLYLPDPPVVAEALRRLRQITGRSLEFDATLTGSARAKAVDALRIAATAR